MESLQKDIAEMGLQIATRPKVKLSKGQSGLLKLIRACVQNNSPLSYDALIQVYYDNVCKIAHDYRYIGEWNDRKQEWFEFDIMECYKAQGSKWMYKVKPRIRQWFTTTLGALVIKNQLIVIPTIELDEK